MSIGVWKGRQWAGDCTGRLAEGEGGRAGWRSSRSADRVYLYFN